MSWGAVTVKAGWERDRIARALVETAQLLGVEVIHADNGTELSSLEIKAARVNASESAYLGPNESTTTGGIPL